MSAITHDRERIAAVYTLFEVRNRDDGKVSMRPVFIAARSSAEAVRLWAEYYASLSEPTWPPLAYVQTDDTIERDDDVNCAVRYPGRCDEEVLERADFNRWVGVMAVSHFESGERIPAVYRSVWPNDNDLPKDIYDRILARMATLEQQYEDAQAARALGLDQILDARDYCGRG